MRFRSVAVVCTLLACALAYGTQPDGWSDRSYYLAMRDGVRIAVSLYFPGEAAPQRGSPTILFQTRYGRATHFAGKAQGDPQRWRAAGYVVAVVDTRGSTASFGTRRVEIGPEEVRDMDEIIAHLASRPWSNGQVIAAGVSYMADTADWATSRPAPQLIAAIPRETDFDAWLHLFFPGGVLNEYMMQGWGQYSHDIDVGLDGKQGGLDCLARVKDCERLFPVLQPVDDDVDFMLLRKALVNRNHWGPDDYSLTQFRDETGGNGYTLFASSPASALREIRRYRKPVQYWGSWVDGGTAEAALARFRSCPDVPMEVWITTNNHSHAVGADPLRPDSREPLPSVERQFELNREFVERVRAGKAIERVIHYAVMGTEDFHDTDVWPPKGGRPVFLALRNGGELTERPARELASEAYDVDFKASTGSATRWTTQFGVPPAYTDRRLEDRKLKVYDGSPLGKDVMLAGDAVVTLFLASKSKDPAVFAYLEDVAPDGRVTYLTEGQLRAVHRKPADPSLLPYDQGPASHTFSASDAQAVIPGELMQLRFALFPVAAMLRKGHRLRLALAGADNNTFHRYSEGGSDTFTIFSGGNRASGVQLTLQY